VSVALSLSWSILLVFISILIKPLYETFIFNLLPLSHLLIITINHGTMQLADDIMAKTTQYLSSWDINRINEPAQSECVLQQKYI
jgi:hypothetical protein